MILTTRLDAAHMLGTLFLAALLARPQDGDGAYVPEIAPASLEGAEAMARIEHPEPLTLSLFAAEPLLANPVCLYVDASGDVYVAETFRLHAGVTDMRNHMDWLDQELANRTVEERVRMFRRFEGDALDERYGVEHERVRLLRDTDGDGRADTSSVFADGFDDYADGIGAGLLSRGGDVYYTCMPHLWLLRDADRDGQAEERRSLSYGYGVHVALLGHDLHGLRIGPDQRLYFSCGDRGFHVQTERGTLAHPHAGAVLRCNLDGSGLEVFATGLRNPQELAFDVHGNLFTGDNNSDGGDRARFVQVVEGSESGWRFAFQYLTEPDLRGPWNDEQLWHAAHPGQAAYVLPPIANLADGPSGLAYNPISNGAPEYAGHFFLCDFRGDAKASGVHAFDLVPKGAGFELGEVERVLWGTLATDCDFGPEGDLWFSDWVQGWGKTGKGRVYRLSGINGEPGERTRVWTKETLAAGMSGRDVNELAAFMTREDMRLRLEAQFELAAHGEEGVRALREMAHYPHDLLPRLHAIWGLGIAGRSDPGVLEFVLGLMEDPEPEVRAQAARVLGDERYARAGERLVTALEDPSARVRMYAALGLGRLREERAVEPLFAFVRATGASDPVLRHAGVMGLASCANLERLGAAAADESPDARLAAVVALRRRQAAELALFLDDPDPLVVLEAARAIHDVPVDAARGRLAALIERPELAGNALVRRVLAANFRAGDEAHARALLAFALRAEPEPRHRAEALALLGRWESPSGRDLVTGEWRPIAPRAADFLPEMLTATSAEFERATTEVTNAWVALVGRARASELAPTLTAWFQDGARDPSTRRACFEVLAELGDERFLTLLTSALRDRDGNVRALALAALARSSRDAMLPLIAEVARHGEIAEQRAAFAALAENPSTAAGALLSDLLGDRMIAGTLPAEVCLDLELALQEGEHAGPRGRLKAFMESRRTDLGSLADWIHCAYGGDAERGEQLFREKAELSCLRCHPLNDDAVGAVGPDLRGLGARLTRLQLLESILEPNARIAPGYEAVLIRLVDESVVAGRILDEDQERLHLITSEGEVLEIELGEIEARRPDLSAMPGGMDRFLDRRELRDLVEFLSRL